MFNEILVIADSLVEPPTEVIPFRTVTLMSHYFLDMEILIHTTQEMKDAYYHFMKRLGMFDYISDILNELEYEEGIRIDVVGYYPHSIMTNYIRIENQERLLEQIKRAAGK